MSLFSVVRGVVGIADPNNPTNILKPNADGSLSTSSGGTSSVLRALKGIQKTTITSSAAETTIVTADAAFKLDIFRLVITNTSASAATVTIKDSTSGTTRFIFAVPAGQTTGFSGPIEAAAIQAAVNSNWTATCTSVASIEITAEFVKNT